MKKTMSEFSDNLEKARALIDDSSDEDDMERAYELVNQALMLVPTSAAAWIVKARVACWFGDLLGGLADIEMARRHRPDLPEVYYWRACICTDLEHPADALASIQEAFDRLRPEDEWLVEYLFSLKAELFQSSGKPDMAMDILKEGLVHCPGSELLKRSLEPLRRASLRASLKVIPGSRV